MQSELEPLKVKFLINNNTEHMAQPKFKYVLSTLQNC